MPIKIVNVLKENVVKYLKYACVWRLHLTDLHDKQDYTQRRVQSDQCYFTVQITDTIFEWRL